MASNFFFFLDFATENAQTKTWNTKYKSRKDEERRSNRYLQMFDVPGAHYLCFDFIHIYNNRFL